MSVQELLVHCEQQVLRFVMRYLATTQVNPKEIADICREVGPSCLAVVWPGAGLFHHVIHQQWQHGAFLANWRQLWLL
jgi:hypothetical protein